MGLHPKPFQFSDCRSLFICCVEDAQPFICYVSWDFYCRSLIYKMLKIHMLYHYSLSHVSQTSDNFMYQFILASGYIIPVNFCVRRQDSSTTNCYGIFLFPLSPEVGFSLLMCCWLINFNILSSGLLSWTISGAICPLRVVLGFLGGRLLAKHL